MLDSHAAISLQDKSMARLASGLRLGSAAFLSACEFRMFAA